MQKDTLEAATEISLDEFLESFDLSDEEAARYQKNPPKTKSLCIWLPIEYKNKYDEQQVRTGRKFGKLIQELVKRTIDKVS